jgi:hypothetical protein
MRVPIWDGQLATQEDRPVFQHRRFAMSTRLLRIPLTLVFIFVLQSIVAPVSRADEVLVWNGIAVRSMLVPPAVGGALQPRTLAIVHVAVFDAVNGIERRYTPIHVEPNAPRGASQRAAAVQAAYTALVLMFPSQTSALDADLEASLAGIAGDGALENSESIRRGREWGEQVAKAIVAWRNLDGATDTLPPWLGGPEIGRWRPTPRPNPIPGGPELAGLPGAFLALATADPFVLPNPSYYRPAGPPPLASLQYAEDFNEVKSVGAFASATRTADQTQSAMFWGTGSASIWNRVAVDAARGRNTTLSQNARLFALLNMAATDSAMAAWDSKAYFEFWRPITAIRLASLDGNAATVEQANWTPLLVTPPYPDYISGNQSLGGSYYAVLTAFFGDDTPVAAYSDGLGPGVVRSFSNFQGLADDALNARIWAGIHFRTAMEDTRITAEKVAAYVLSHAALPIHGQRVGQLSK